MYYNPYPSFNSAEKIINKSIGSKVILLVGRCAISYNGRARSTLRLGERVVMLKEDGALLVHKSRKREPVNWQPPGCTAIAKTTNEGIEIISKRSNPDEIITIIFKQLKLLATRFWQLSKSIS